MKRNFFALLALSVFVSVPQAFAADKSLVGIPIVDEILSTIIYSAVGILMAFIAYKVIDVITPGHLSTDIAENSNMALAVLAGSIMLGVCIIIAAVLAS